MLTRLRIFSLNGYIRIMLGIYLANAWNGDGKSQAYAGHTPGQCLANYWHLPMCLAYAWDMPCICSAHAWHMAGTCLAFVCLGWSYAWWCVLLSCRVSVWWAWSPQCPQPSSRPVVMSCPRCLAIILTILMSLIR